MALYYFRVVAATTTTTAAADAATAVVTFVFHPLTPRRPFQNPSCAGSPRVLSINVNNDRMQTTLRHPYHPFDV